MGSLVRRYKGSYFAYVLAYVGLYFAMAVFSSILSVYLTDIGKTASQVSLIVSASSIFSFVVVPLTGYITDRTQKPKAISAGLLLGTGAMGLVFGMCRSVWALFLLNGLILSFFNSVMPISERMAGRSKYRYGTLRVWGTAGYAVGAQAAGFAMEFIAPGAIFVLLPVAGLVAAVGFWGTENTPPLPTDSSSPEEKTPRPSVLQVLANPSFFLFLLIACLFLGCSNVNMTYAPLLLNSLGVPTSTVGTVLFFSTLVEAPIIIFSNKYMDRFSGKTLILASFSIILVQFLFYGFTRSAAVAILAMVFLKAIASTLFVMINLKVVRNLLDPRYTTTGLSVINSATNLAGILVQNAGGILVDHTSIHTLYLVLCGLAGLGLVLTLFLKVGNREKVFS